MKLRELLKLTKTYYKNGKTKIDFDKLDQMSKGCTHLILKAKDEYTEKMSLTLSIKWSLNWSKNLLVNT